jgi:hydroxyacylglutathione hydrolase
MFFRQVFDPNLAQYAYLVGCQRTGEAIVIDPQRDIDRYMEIAAEEGLIITTITETHIHADYLSGAREFADRYAVKLYLSDEGGPDWKYFWAEEDGYDFHPLQDGAVFRVGNIEFEALHTPGHTPEHLSFLITDRGGGADVPMGLASGDFVFVGDLGRPDLLETAAGEAGAREPAARTLYRTVQRFLDLPDYLQVWPGHGAGSACGKALGAVPESTVGYEKRFNASIRAAEGGEEAFVDSILEGQPEPPIYFARMKHDNKHGPALLGALPSPGRLSDEALGKLSGRTGVAVVDTRSDRLAFMKGHLPGSLYAPLDKTFPTITGSYITPEMPVYLIVEDEAEVREAVLNLIRIGLDNVAGYALAEALEARDDLASTRHIDTVAMEKARRENGTTVLDVRRQSEFDEGHVPGAVNIAHTRLLERKDELDTGTAYLVHCRTGARAAAATALLERYGIDVVYVDGMFDDWKKATVEEGNMVAH